MARFRALCQNGIDQGRVVVPDKKMNLLFVKSSGLTDQSAPRPQRAVMNVNSILREEQGMRQVHQLLGIIVSDRIER